MFPLMEVLNQYEHDYHIFCDWQMRPRGDKQPDLRRERTKEALSYLANKVDAVILPPSLELQLSGYSTGKDHPQWVNNIAGGKETIKIDPTSSAENASPTILPLFHNYLMEHAFKYSIVWKLWLLCEYADLDEAEELIKNVAKEYTSTANQAELWKKFHQPFALWNKNVRMRNYFLTTYGKRDPMVRGTLKHDLRYFQDAAVDTLIPMSRWFLFYQRLIAQRTNRKKIRFHWLGAVKSSFETLVSESKSPSSKTSYAVTLHCTDTTQVLLGEKKWKRVLERGGKCPIEIKKVNLS